MAYRTIPDVAVNAGALASAYLARALRDNDVWLDNARSSVASQLLTASGHVHTTGVRSFSYNFDDRIKTTALLNDQLDFRFAGGIATATTYTITLTAAIRTPAVMADHIRDTMKGAVFSAFPAFGSVASVPINVIYDMVLESETRGLFLIQNTGTTDSPQSRVFQLLFKTGAGAQRSVAPSIGFAKRDLKGAYGYVAESGFADSFEQDKITLKDGNLLGTIAFNNNAFITAKFADRVVSTEALDTGSVAGGPSGQIANGAVVSEKFGNASLSILSIGAGATAAVLFDPPNKGPLITPMIAVACTDVVGSRFGDLEIVSLVWSPGDNAYSVSVRNNSAATRGCALAGY